MEKGNKNRILILHRILRKSDLIMDDIAQLMHIYSTNKSVLKTKGIEKYRNILIEQLENPASKSSK